MTNETNTITNSIPVTLVCLKRHEWETTATEGGIAMPGMGKAAFAVLYEVDRCPTCGRKWDRLKR
jgi:hypothetical protein